MSRIITSVCVLLSILALPAIAQNFPTKPIRLYVGFAAGGPTDVLARVVAEEMGRQLGQPVVVENRPGANGLLAPAAVKAADPDGYSMFSGSVQSFSPIFMTSGLLATKEFAPVSSTAAVDWFIYVRSDLAARSLKDLPALAKTSGGRIRLGVSSQTNAMYMAAVAKELGLTYDNSFETIPYKTNDQVIRGLLAGDIHATVSVLTGFEPHIASGKLRGLATLSPQRASQLPDVQTASEQGVPIVQRPRHGIWVPLGTPRNAITTLNRAVNESIRQPGVAEKITRLAMSPRASTPEELMTEAEGELRFAGEFARVLGIQPQ